MLLIVTLLIVVFVVLKKLLSLFSKKEDKTDPNYGKKKKGKRYFKKHPLFYVNKRPYEPLKDHEYTVPYMLEKGGKVYNQLKNPQYAKRIKNSYEYYSHDEVVSISKQFLSGLRIACPFLKPGSLVGVYLDTCFEYMTTMYGLHYDSMVCVQCYPNLGAKGLKYVVNEGSLGVLITSAHNIPIIEKICHDCPTLKRVVIILPHGISESDVEVDDVPFEVSFFDGVVAQGKENMFQGWTSPKPETLANIMYTSGMELKGIELTHKNIISAVHQITCASDQEPDRVYLSYLPVSHIMELIAHFVFALNGSTVYFGSPSTLFSRRGVIGDAELCRPNRFCVVPKILERVRKGVLLQIEKSNFLVKTLFKFYLNTKVKYMKRNGKLLWIPFEGIIFGRVINLFGGRMDYIMCGGSPLSPETQLFFRAVLGKGFTICNGYGLTETSASLSLQTRDNLKVSTQGFIVKDIDARLKDVPELDYYAKDNVGELAVRGPMVFSRYFKNPEVTKEAFDDDGYFCTGDVVRINNNGSITIIGTKKTIVKLSHGEYVPLVVLENLYETSPFIFMNGLCIFADSYKEYIVAVAVIDTKFVKVWAEHNHVKVSTEDELLKNEKLINAVLENLREIAIKSGRIHYEIIQNIHLTTDKWNTENGLLTEEMSFKRKLMKEKYSDVIANMHKKGPSLKGRAISIEGATISTNNEIEIVTDLPEFETIENKLKVIVMETMALNELQVDTNLFDLGMTSFMLKQIYVKLPKDMQKLLSATDLYSHPTVSGVAKQFLINLKKSAESPVFKRMIASNRVFDDEFAVIGMSCCVPGAENLSEFWENCLQQRIGVEFPDEYNNEAIYMMKGKKEFDHSMFDIPISIARIMNPAFRKYLEMVYHCLEDAGYDPMRLQNRDLTVGAFCSMSDNYYLTDLFTNVDSLPLKNKHTLSSYNSQLFFSGFLGYYLNLCGPTLFIGSACSSGVSSLKVAMNSLSKHECGMALVGGISIKDFEKYSRKDLPMQSSDGYNRAFDHRASGTIFGEGGGCVLVKPLKKAQKDGDHIYCVIKSAYVNNDGYDSKKMSFVAPSIEGQRDVIENAYIHAGVNPNTLRYFEAHGTGTDIGDVVEMEALKRVFNSYTHEKGFIHLGAVKNNISHLDNASGIMGVIKSALVLDKKIIPGIAGFQKPNPLLRIEDSPFIISTENCKWEENEEPFPRRAGVSSFGMGGNNGHVVLEENPKIIEEDDEQGRISQEYNLLLLSAKSEYSLDKMKENLLCFLKDHSNLNMSDVAYTLQVGRRELPLRKFLVCNNQADAIEILHNNIEYTQMNKKMPKETKIVFMYPGMGSQYWRMSADIYSNHSEYRRFVDRCIESVKVETGHDFSGFFTSSEDRSEDLEKKVYEIPYSQLYLFIVEYSLSMFLETLGIKPDYVMGHSFGEIIAAIVSGMFSFEEGIKIIIKRAELARRLEDGRMLSVSTNDFDALKSAIKHLNEKEGEIKVEIAVINSPKNVVISGRPKAIETLKITLEKDYKMFSKMLKNDRGFHSFLVDPMVEKFEDFMSLFYSIDSQRAPKVGFVSTALGKVLDKTSAKYWGSQLREKVRFPESIAAVLKREKARFIFLEVGPSMVLSKLVRENQVLNGNFCVSLCRHPNLKENDDIIFLKGIGNLWNYGVKNINWNRFYESKRKRVSLPSYPFEKKTCWVDFEKTIFYVDRDEKNNAFQMDEIELMDTKKTVTYEKESLLMKSILTAVGKIKNMKKESSNVNRKPDLLRDEPANNKKKIEEEDEECEGESDNEKDQSMKKKMLLTGCTGLLGGFILQELLTRFPESEIHCLVRKQSLNKISQEMTENPAVKIIPGDLGLKKFDLSKEAFEELAETVDLIIHCGANAKLAMLSDLYNVNVRSVFDIVELSRGYKPIYYISTLAVYSNFPPPGSKTLENEIHIPFNGYGSSKFIVDSLLQDQYPNSTIFRCCPIINTITEGSVRVDPNKQVETDVLLSILKIISDMGVSPDLDSVDVPLNLIPANYLATKIVDMMVENEKAGEYKKVFNVSYQNLTLKKMIMMLMKVNGKEYPTTPLKQWIAAVEEKYDDPRVLSAKWIFQLILRDELNNGFTSDCFDSDFPLGDGLESVTKSDLEKYTEIMKGITLKTTEEVNRESGGEEFDKLKDEVEKVWKQLFQLKEIRSSDNFFEIGGDSLLFTELIVNVEKKFRTKIKLSEFYKRPTIDNMSRILSKKDSVSIVPMRKFHSRKADRSIVKKKDFAIVGMCCRFPGANTVSQFWKNLVEQVVSISKVDGHFHYVISERNKFDYEFFKISKATSIITSPTYRIFLEMCYHCLEDAGYDLQREDSKRIGLFSSVGDSNYFSELVQNVDSLPIKNIPVIYNHNSPHTFSGYVSYNLDIKGPSFSVSSACSSTLLAVKIACENIVLGKCEMALIGGLKIKDLDLYTVDKIAMESEDCRNRAFDHRSDGTVFGEGGGVVMIKLLEKAIEHGDHIYSVIKGAAMNNDGYDSNKMSFAAPSLAGQSSVIQEALHESGVDPETIGYIECHGTATKIGDTVEFDALKNVFGQYTQKKNFIKLGAVKNNISHLDNSAGIAGLIKTALVVQKGIIPGNANFEKVNPFIDVEDSPFIITNENSDWKNEKGLMRRAGVSSFGMGGNNSHLIVEQYDLKKTLNEFEYPYQLLPFSTASEESMKIHLKNFEESLVSNGHSIHDVAYTMQIGRRELKMRKFFVSQSGEDAVKQLVTSSEALIYQNDLIKGGKKPKIVFMFPGMGSQYPTMTLDIYETVEYFKEQVDLCVATAKTVIGIELGFFFDRAQIKKAKEFCYKNNYAQMYLFVVEYAMAKLMMLYGITPDFIMGHSFGEYVGGVVAGVFDLKDGMKVVHDTAVIMEKLEKGLMLSVSTTEMDSVMKEVEKMNESLGGLNLELSVVNSPKNFVISGRVKAVQALKKILDGKGVNCRLLHTPNAYHCFLMDDVVPESCEIVKKFHIRRHKIPFMSAVTAKLVENKFTSEYWGHHLREKVEFSQTVQNLIEMNDESDGGLVFIEVGPHIVLNKLVREQQLDSEKLRVVSLGKHPKLQDNEFKVILTSIGDIWSTGVSIDWKAYHGKAIRYRVPLPHYPFHHEVDIEYEKRFVPEKKLFKDLELMGMQRQSCMRGKKVNFTCIDTWQNLVNYTVMPWLEHHIFQSVVIVPGASWVSLYLEFSPCVENIHFFQVLKVNETEHAIIQTVKEEGTGRLKVMSKPFDQPNAEWTLRSDGVPSTPPKRKPVLPQYVLDHMERLDECIHYDHKTFYARFYEIDFMFGKPFMCIQDIYKDKKSEMAYATIRVINKVDLPIENYMVQPVIMDNFLQCVFGTTQYISETFLPNNIEKVVLYEPKFPEILRCHCKVTNMTEDYITADYVIFDENLKVYMEIFNFRGINLKRQIERDPDAKLFEIHYQKKGIPELPLLSIPEPSEKEEPSSVEKELLKAIENVAPENVVEVLSFVPKKKEEEEEEVEGEEESEGENEEEEKEEKEEKEEEEEETLSLIEKFYTQSSPFTQTLEYVSEIVKETIDSIVKRDAQQVIKILDLDQSGYIARVIAPLLLERDGFVEYSILFGELKDEAKKVLKDLPYVSFKKIALDQPLWKQEDSVLNNSIDIVLGFNLEGLDNVSECLVENGKIIAIHPQEESVWQTIFKDRNEVDWKIILEKEFHNIQIVESLPFSVVFAERSCVKIEEPKEVFEHLFSKDPMDLIASIKKLESKQEPVNLLIFFENALESPEYAEVFGIAKVLKNEYPDWDVRLVDIVGDGGGDIIGSVVEKISQNPSLYENEIRVDSKGFIYAPRIVPALSSVEKPVDEMKYYHIEKAKNAIKNTIAVSFNEFVVPELENDQLFVRVHCGTVNFRDVLILMSLLIDETTQNVGYEFSGVVVAVGPKCKKFKIGDPIFGFGRQTYGSYCVTEENIVAKKPDFLSFQQAASIPMAFCTADFCLHDLGKIEKGDKVLIHSASGNVGQAAIQYCNHHGAEIYATVGSQKKRDYLMKTYGVTRFADSHDEDWDLDMKALCPSGFDIIINSLRGEGIKKGVLLLKERGRFCEIGWRDIVDNMKMGLRRFIRNISFTAFNLKRIGEDKDKQYQINRSLEGILPLIKDGILKTTIDKEFRIDDASSAYRYLLKNDYLGKIIINILDENGKTIIPKGKNVVPVEKFFSPDKTYVISGGLGGLGVELFRWMASHGAERIVLLSRLGKTTDRHERLFVEVKKEYNCEIVVVKADVGDPGSVKEMYAGIDNLGGVFHLAVVYNDQAIKMIDDENYAFSVNAKKNGALNLLNFCPSAEKLEFFLSFSTLATVVGNPGQASYTAANIYCEILSRKLRQRGVNAYALCVPNIINVGIIARDHVVRRKMRIAGLLQTGMTSDELFVYVELILTRKRVKGGQASFLTKYDFGSFFKESNLKIGEQVSHLCQGGDDAGSLKEKKKINYDSINAVVKDVISSEQDIDPTRYLMEYGVDSLTAVELSAILKSEFGVFISQMDLVSGLTINKILEIAKAQEEKE